MRLIPSSRRGRGALAAVVVLAVASVPLWGRELKQQVEDLFDRTYEDAAGRTSDPAAVGGAVALPVAVDASAPTGADPAVELREVAALPGASAVADPPGPGPVLVTTLDGVVHALDLASGVVDAVLDLSALVSTGGERGLLGAAVDPDGDRLYLDYTGTDGDTEIRSWPLDARHLPTGGPDDGVLHLAIGQPHPNHNGGHLAFGPDGALWIGTGDGGGAGDEGRVARDGGSLLGKILRVVPLADGGVEAPSTNPHRGGRPEVWGIGLRNPWRFSFDADTNRLWVADVGQEQVEEVSVVDPDGEHDFGWSDVEGDQPYNGEPDERFVPPVIAYGHDEGCSVTGGYVYRGEAVASLQGWYLYGDFCGGWVRAVPADDPDPAPVELVTGAGPVVSFAELEDRELLVLTDRGVYAVEPG